MDLVPNNRPNGSRTQPTHPRGTFFAVAANRHSALGLKRRGDKIWRHCLLSAERQKGRIGFRTRKLGFRQRTLGMENSRAETGRGSWPIGVRRTGFFCNEERCTYLYDVSGVFLKSGNDPRDNTWWLTT